MERERNVIDKFANANIDDGDDWIFDDADADDVDIDELLQLVDDDDDSKEGQA